MPSRHIEKVYADDAFYHVFNRGVEKRIIFQEDADYTYFTSLFSRYLGPEQQRDAKYRMSPNYSAELELLAYCLMPNHFHLMVYQRDKDAMQKFMRSLCTAYSMYFNNKYSRVGSLFQDRYKAVRIAEASYYTHISRYIHLNPLDMGENYLKYPHSSLQYWIGSNSACPGWLKPSKAKEEFNSSQEYLVFLEDYREVKDELDNIKKSLKE